MSENTVWLIVLVALVWWALANRKDWYRSPVLLCVIGFFVILIGNHLAVQAGWWGP